MTKTRCMQCLCFQPSQKGEGKGGPRQSTKGAANGQVKERPGKGSGRGNRNVNIEVAGANVLSTCN